MDDYLLVFMVQFWLLVAACCFFEAMYLLVRRLRGLQSATWEPILSVLAALSTALGVGCVAVLLLSFHDSTEITRHGRVMLIAQEVAPLMGVFLVLLGIGVAAIGLIVTAIRTSADKNLSAPAVLKNVGLIFGSTSLGGTVLVLAGVYWQMNL